MDGFINMPDDYMVRYRDKRIKTEFGHGRHGPARDAGPYGMIGGDGINDESNKTRHPYCGCQLAETQKGHSPDSAAEGFLGRMKTESVYPEHWEECACDEVLVLIDDYIHWYNHARIKRSFGWMSPVECRQRTKEGLRDCLQENVRSTFFHAECGGEFDDPGIGEPLGVFGVERPLSCKGNSCGNAVVESTCVSASCRPAIPQPAPQSPPSAPSWDVPSADSSATFPDVL